MSKFKRLIYTIYIRKAYDKISKNTFTNYKRNGPRLKVPLLKLPQANRPQVLLPKRPRKYAQFIVKKKNTELHYFTNMVVYYGILACLTIFKDIFIHKLYFST